MQYSEFIAELLCLDKMCDWVKINLNQNTNCNNTTGFNKN